MAKNFRAQNDELTEEEIAKRRDEVLRRMLETPPQPRKQRAKTKPPKRVKPKQREG